MILGSVDDIPVGEGRAYSAGGEAIAVFRLRDGSLRATQALCPHRGGPLADGQIDAKVVVCPMHLTAFDLTTGCSPAGGLAVRTYPVSVGDDRQIVIQLEVPA
jgi:nitrite reductase (NADH) small subunit